MITAKQSKRWRFLLRTRLMVAQLSVLLIAVYGACGGDVDGGATSSSSPGVACDQAADGDPCDMPGDSCGPIECYGCSKHCANGAWDVTCSEAPTCDDVTVAQGALCDFFCAQLTCGPFDIDTACGPAKVQASCNTFGWFYELPCDPDCESLSESACGAKAGCVWAVSCTDNPNTTPLSPRCIDFPPTVGTCEGVECPDGTSCVTVSLSHQPSSGDCSGGGALVPLCVAP
jgi:hypothetical protein